MDKKKKMMLKMGLGARKMVKSAETRLSGRDKKYYTKSAAKKMEGGTKSAARKMVKSAETRLSGRDKKYYTKSAAKELGTTVLPTKAHPTMGGKGWDPKASEKENLERILGTARGAEKPLKKKTKKSSEYMKVIKGMK